jgi:hypothetical protein
MTYTKGVEPFRVAEPPGDLLYCMPLPKTQRAFCVFGLERTPYHTYAAYRLDLRDFGTGRTKTIFERIEHVSLLPPSLDWKSFPLLLGDKTVVVLDPDGQERGRVTLDDPER